MKSTYKVTNKIMDTYYIKNEHCHQGGFKMDCLQIKEGKSLVRVFQAAPQIGKVDIYIDGALVFSGLDFMEFTEYVELEEGEHTVGIYLSGTTENPVIDQMLEVDEGQMYTVAVTGNIGDLSLLIIKDYSEKQPSSEYSTFRVIHLSPNAPAVDILVNGETFFEDIGFREGTSYVDVNPGTYNVKLVVSESKDVVFPLRVKLNPDRIYTIYAIGQLGSLGVIQSVDGNTYLCKEA